MERLKASVNNIDIDADYTGIKMGYDSGLNFDFDIQIRYAGLNGENDLTIQHSDRSNNSKKFSGYHGSKNSGATIKINSEYGGVTLIKH